MIRVACIDDEANFRDTVKDFLNSYAAEKGVEFDIRFFENGMDFFDGKAIFDLLFVDVDMPKMDGFRLTKKIREYDDKCVIVFITNLQNYAIRGYEVDAADYILKPLSYPIFSRKLDKILKTVMRNVDKSLALTVDRTQKVIDINDIIYVEKSGHKVIWHMTDGDFEQWASMKDVCEKLDGGGFALCNSGCVVNLRYVESIKQTDITVKGVTLAISRPKRQSFLDAVARFLG